MEYSDQELLDIVEEIDAIAAEVSIQDGRFIEDVLERAYKNPEKPARFSRRQRQWVMDMKERYLK